MYKSDESEGEANYIYYYDWGSSMGTNWIVSPDFNSSKVSFTDVQTQQDKILNQSYFQQAVVSSPNLEHLDSTCVDDIHEKSSFKPFMVKSRLGWLEDKYVCISKWFHLFVFLQELAADMCSVWRQGKSNPEPLQIKT